METRNQEGIKTSTLQNVSRWLLGASLLLSGIGHLTFARKEFLAQVPDWVSFNGDLIVVLSGIAEVVMGGALLFLPKYKVPLGWIAAAFFVLVFPGNISQYVNGVDAFGLNSDTSRAVRLFFQPVLVAWALWCTGAWSTWRASQKGERKA